MLKIHMNGLHRMETSLSDEPDVDLTRAARDPVIRVVEEQR